MKNIYQYISLSITIIFMAVGQTIYVPVYSHIYYLNQQKPFNLATTVSIRNTDSSNTITVNSVRYYDKNGQLIREYSQPPLKLSPLASTEFFIGQNDLTGGIGANFIVEWIAEQKVSQPVVEAVMIGSAGTLGFSFLSPGRVIETIPPASGS